MLRRSALLMAAIVAVSFSAQERAGCKLPDGSFKELHSKWINGTEYHGCESKSEGAEDTPYIAVLGCAFHESWWDWTESKPDGSVSLVGKNATTDMRSMPKKCALVGNAYAMRDLTAEEEEYCIVNGTKVKSGTKYTTQDGKEIYECLEGRTFKFGCVIEGQTIGHSKVAYIRQKAYHCNRDAGIIDFGNITGCKRPDGSLAKFQYQWINGTEFHECQFKIEGDNITASINVVGCADYTKWNPYSSGKVEPVLVGIGSTRGAVTNEGTFTKVCALVGRVYMMRDFTKEDYANKEKGEKAYREYVKNFKG